MHTTPVSLLQRLREPDQPEAWERFVDLYTPLLYYWTRRLGLQPQDAADLVQEVLTTLVQKLPQFTYNPRKSFRAWLRTVTLNRWHDLQRQRTEQPLPGNAPAFANLAVADQTDFLEEHEYRQHLIRRALQIMQADFQPTTWKACWEYVVQGRPAAEVAAAFGIRVSMVYTAKSRVLKRLRQELEGLLD